MISTNDNLFLSDIEEFEFENRRKEYRRLNFCCIFKDFLWKIFYFFHTIDINVLGLRIISRNLSLIDLSSIVSIKVCSKSGLFIIRTVWDFGVTNAIASNGTDGSFMIDSIRNEPGRTNLLKFLYLEFYRGTLWNYSRKTIEI